MNKILDYLFPNHACFACGREINVSETKNFCDECVATFKRNDGVKTGKTLNAGFAPFFYTYDNDGLGRIIMDLKYGGNSLAARPLAKFMADALSPKITYDFMVPVPLSKNRAKQRGYNQSELLAQGVHEITQIPIRTDIIERIRNTKPQKNMTHAMRRENQKDAYKILDRPEIKDKTILIVDDVMTSGATAEEIARMLKLGKAKRVDAVAVAVVAPSPT